MMGMQTSTRQVCFVNLLYLVEAGSGGLSFWGFFSWLQDSKLDPLLSWRFHKRLERRVAHEQLAPLLRLHLPAWVPHA